MATSVMFMSLTQRFITSIGQTAPAMIPVRSDDRSRVGEVGMAEHRDEHRRHAVDARCTAPVRSAASVAAGSNPVAGITIVAPCVVQPRLPITMPKQW